MAVVCARDIRCTGCCGGMADGSPSPLPDANVTMRRAGEHCSVGGVRNLNCLGRARRKAPSEPYRETAEAGRGLRHRARAKELSRCTGSGLEAARSVTTSLAANKPSAAASALGIIDGPDAAAAAGPRNHLHLPHTAWVPVELMSQVAQVHVSGTTLPWRLHVSFRGAGAGASGRVGTFGAGSANASGSAAACTLVAVCASEGAASGSAAACAAGAMGTCVAVGSGLVTDCTSVAVGTALMGSGSKAACTASPEGTGAAADLRLGAKTSASSAPAGSVRLRTAGRLLSTASATRPGESRYSRRLRPACSAPSQSATKAALPLLFMRAARLASRATCAVDASGAAVTTSALPSHAFDSSSGTRVAVASPPLVVPVIFSTEAAGKDGSSADEAASRGAASETAHMASPFICITCRDVLESAGGVVATASSWISDNRSTVGAEARFAAAARPPGSKRAKMRLSRASVSAT